MNTPQKNTNTPSAPYILVVDDEPDLRTLYELTLLREGYLVDAAEDVQQARALLQQNRYHVVITDMRLPDGLGLELLLEVREQQRSERCIVMTAYGSAENAVESLKAGAFDYLTKPVDLKQFRMVVASAIQGSGSADKSLAGTHSTASTDVARAALQRLIGDSAGMQAVKQRITKVAPSMAPVLIRGESGTGKELVARALHACSQRAQGPLVAVNCGAIPENLLEAEFFGARKGSYTGAQQDREGYFQAAHGGTLFLDEIGDLPLNMQAKLLRAIQERKIRPLGSTQEMPVDVRIVSATHKDLNAATHTGEFRQDLYYRLNVIEVLIPPLRERREDLPALCHALLERIAHDSGQGIPALSAQALEEISQHPLSGNVRELENLLHRALALNDDAQQLSVSEAIGKPPSAPHATSAHASSSTPQGTEPSASSRASSTVSPPPSTHSTASNFNAPETSEPSTPTAQPSHGDELPHDLQAHLDDIERGILLRALQENRYNRTAASQRLGLTLRQMRYRIERLNINIPQDPREPQEAGADHG